MEAGRLGDYSRRFFLRGTTAASLLSATSCRKIQNLLGLKEEHGLCLPPPNEEIDLISHAISRLSFGPTPSDYHHVKKLGVTHREAVNAYIEEQLNPQGIDDHHAQRAMRRFESLHAPLGEMYEYKEKHLLEQLTSATLMGAVQSKRQLYELMVHFWSDHFNIDVSKKDCKWLKAADDREVIRKHTFGNFLDLVSASALSPAMLWYLDGRQNRKRQPADYPNENYARELLELHTLGLNGGYTQKDVMEVARCLSGWTVRSKKRFFKGRVEFDPASHDDGAKVVLGHQISAGGGQKDLKEVLKILCEHPSTAQHLAEKLCVRFIADQPSAQSIKDVAETFMATSGDLTKVLRRVFSTEEFLTGPRGGKLKKPFELIVSSLRATRAEISSTANLIDYLVSLGHAPFQYPSPDGYPDVAAPWVGGLFWRWHFAIGLARNQIHPKIRIREAKLFQEAGGIAGFSAVLFGRKPTQEELMSFHRSGEPLAMALASPAFQWR